MTLRAGLACAVVSIALAALAEQTFFALFEWPAWGRPTSDLVFITRSEVLRPWHVLTVLSAVTLAVAGLGSVIAARRRQLGTSVAIAATVLLGWWISMASQRPRTWSIALMDSGTVGTVPPWTHSGAALLAAAVAFLIASALLLCGRKAGTVQFTPSWLALAISAFALVSIGVALVLGQALPWWVVPLGVATSSGAVSRLVQIGAERLVPTLMIPGSLLGAAMAAGAFTRDDNAAATVLGIVSACLFLMALAQLARPDAGSGAPESRVAPNAR